jgi:hypothetical protein
MSLREELQQQLLAFVDGSVKERELFAWLGGAGRHIDQEDVLTREIWKTAVSLLSEVAGHPHDVDAVQREIASLLRMAAGQYAQAPNPAGSHFADETLDQIRRYVNETITARDLSHWLDAHAQEIHDTGMLELRGLADLAFSLLEEALQGTRTDESVRRSLATAVPPGHRITSRVG